MILITIFKFKKKLKIYVSTSNLNGLKPKVLGVENRLEQILANVLDNAVSFSPDGGKIEVLCNANKSKVQLSIIDEGPGFNESNINQIFSRFYSNRPEKFGEHSGLGLNIVKNIIELHGGTIQASTEMRQRREPKLIFSSPFITVNSSFELIILILIVKHLKNYVTRF